MESTFILAISFFFIAMIYASVGFGGGSSYLALMALMHVPLNDLRPAALLCNIIVVSGGVIIFLREHKLDLKRSAPFILASIPMAFVGGYWKIEKESTFFILLGVSLIVAASLLWIRPENLRRIKSDNNTLNISLGGAIGFLSGLVSIGGGIFLAPVLHLIDWDEAKKISALASLFILVNSISGLSGQLLRIGSIDWTFIIPLLLAVLLGGQIGSRLGARRFNPLYIKRITAVLILVAGINILKDNLW